MINESDLKDRIINGYPIYLNIYHKNIFSEYLQLVGLGMFHSTIEIFDLEFSFGFCETGMCGITVSKSGISNKMKIKEKIYLGHTHFNLKTIKELIYTISSSWEGSTYNPFIKNCNDFTKDFSTLLLEDNAYYPEYVNLLAGSLFHFESFFKPIIKIVIF